MNYTKEDLIEFSNGQLNCKYYERATNALNSLAHLIGKNWIQNELSLDNYKENFLIEQLGGIKLYKGVSAVEELVFLWEDLELLKGKDGFTNVVRKLERGVRFENIDLEISIAADFIRCNSIVELEPLVGIGSMKADCKFKIPSTDNWIFVEITRKQIATTQNLIDRRANELAEIVSSINPNRRNVIVVKRHLSDTEYNDLCIWLKSRPGEGAFQDFAQFFSVPHGQDDTPFAFDFVNSPISVRQAGGDLLSNGFGVAYLHIPDYGAKNKMKDKVEQLPKDSQAVYFIDLSNVSGGISDWEKQIEFTEDFKHFSAIVLTQSGIESAGHFRECKLILNPNSTNMLADITMNFLCKFSNIRKGRNLIYAQE